MKILIDEKSGFCTGVKRTIKIAEEILTHTKELYCLGDIVHNGEEVKRLEKLGLVVINKEEYYNLSNCKVLIRTHGEPPETYKYAEANNIELIEGTCPVVLKLQKKIKDTGKELNTDGQIVIFGKPDHAEVIGLAGQTEMPVCIINDESVSSIDTNKPIRLFAQTTMEKEKYEKIIDIIKRKLPKDGNLEITSSICGQVSNRGKWLEQFCRKFEAVIFVGGKKSSNSQVLFEVCKAANKNSYFITNKTDLAEYDFSSCKSIGICGATSTPQWLMQDIANALDHTYNKP